jgi:hypothetical protein
MHRLMLRFAIIAWCEDIFKIFSAETAFHSNVCIFDRETYALLAGISPLHCCVTGSQQGGASSLARFGVLRDVVFSEKEEEKKKDELCEVL